jgi:hypothetical protein
LERKINDNTICFADSRELTTSKLNDACLYSDTIKSNCRESPAILSVDFTLKRYIGGRVERVFLSGYT